MCVRSKCNFSNPLLKPITRSTVLLKCAVGVSNKYMCEHLVRPKTHRRVTLILQSTAKETQLKI